MGLILDDNDFVPYDISIEHVWFMFLGETDKY